MKSGMALSAGVLLVGGCGVDGGRSREDQVRVLVETSKEFNKFLNLQVVHDPEVNFTDCFLINTGKKNGEQGHIKLEFGIPNGITDEAFDQLLSYLKPEGISDYRGDRLGESFRQANFYIFRDNITLEVMVHLKQFGYFRYDIDASCK